MVEFSSLGVETPRVKRKIISLPQAEHTAKSIISSMWVLNVSYKYRRRTVSNVHGRGIGMQGFWLLFLTCLHLKCCRLIWGISRQNDLWLQQWRYCKSPQYSVFTMKCTLEKTSQEKDDLIQAIPSSSLLCWLLALMYLDVLHFLGSKQVPWVCGSSLPFAAPAQEKLKSFCATELLQEGPTLTTWARCLLRDKPVLWCQLCPSVQAPKLY